MAVVLNYSIVQSPDFSYLIFTDSTGLKPSPSTGYGSPDIVPSAVTLVTVALTFPNSTTILTSPNLTKSVLNTTFNLTTTMFGVISFPDGYYVVTYLVSDGTNTFTQTKTFFFFGATACCIQGGLVNQKQKKDCFSKSDLTLLIAQMYLEGAKIAFSKCNLQNRANELIGLASELCKKENCGCGCGGGC